MRSCPTCHLQFQTEVSRCGIHGDALVTVDDDPLIGTTLDRYVIDRLLGEGAMGCVYRASHVALENRQFAVKVLFGEHAARRTFVTRLRREAEVASKLSHANIVNTVDFGTTPQGVTFLVMEYCACRTLADLVAASAPLSFERASSLTAQIAAGLAHAHERGFVHRDVKGSNILLTESDGGEVAKLVDFGVVDVAASQMDATKLTATGVVFGTPLYMSPEQMRGAPVEPAADVYALGTVLYTMIAGRAPFDGDVAELAHKKLSGPPPPPPSCGGLEHLAMRMLALEPALRPTATEIIETIERAENGRLPDRPALGPDTLAMMAAAGVRARLGPVIACVLAVLLCVGGWVLMSGTGDSRGDDEAPQVLREQTPAPPAALPNDVDRGQQVASKKVAEVPQRRRASGQENRGSAPPAVVGPRDAGATPSLQQTGRVNVVVTRHDNIRAQTISVDGRMHGQSPVQIELRVGAHRIGVHEDGAATVYQTVTVETGRTARVVFGD